MYDPRADLYILLGVSDITDDGVIRQAHRTRILGVHPDHNGSTDATRTTAALNAARDILLDPSKRQKYDEARSLWHLQMAPKYQSVTTPVPTAAPTPSPVTPTPQPVVTPSPMANFGFGRVEGFEQRVESYFKTPPASPVEAFFRGVLLGFDVLATANRAGRES